MQTFDSGEQFEIFADKLAQYTEKKRTIPYLKTHGAVETYKAVVISKNDGEKTMVVQRPYDVETTLPYANSADGLSPGDVCTVAVFGDPTNSVVIADGKMNIAASGGEELSWLTVVNGVPSIIYDDGT